MARLRHFEWHCRHILVLLQPKPKHDTISQQPMCIATILSWKTWKNSTRLIPRLGTLLLIITTCKEEDWPKNLLANNLPWSWIYFESLAGNDARALVFQGWMWHRKTLKSSMLLWHKHLIRDFLQRKQCPSLRSSWSEQERQQQWCDSGAHMYVAI